MGLEEKIKQSFDSCMHGKIEGTGYRCEKLGRILCPPSQEEIKVRNLFLRRIVNYFGIALYQISKFLGLENVFLCAYREDCLKKCKTCEFYEPKLDSAEQQKI